MSVNELLPKAEKGAFAGGETPVGSRNPSAAEASRRPFRVAVINYFLPVPGKKRGGVERLTFDLAQGFARRGHQVSVWTYDEKPADGLFDVRPLPGRSIATHWLGKRLTMGYLGNLLFLLPDYDQADVLIVMGDSLLLPLRWPGRVIRMMHGSAWEEAMSASNPLRCIAQTGVYAQELLTALTNRHTVGISHNCRRWNPLIRKVIPIGVDTSLFCPGGEKTEEPSILFVGTLEGRKRGGLLVQWFQETIRKRFPQASLHMVCRPGPESPGVRYHTAISRERLIELYRQAWVYATPSAYEGFGLPYVEAMACGAAVVASPNPGSREVLADGRYGALPADDEFAEAVCRLLADDARRAEAIALGFERANWYSIDSTLDAYESLFSEIA